MSDIRPAEPTCTWASLGTELRAAASTFGTRTLTRGEFIDRHNVKLGGWSKRGAEEAFRDLRASGALVKEGRGWRCTVTSDPFQAARILKNVDALRRCRGLGQATHALPPEDDSALTDEVLIGWYKFAHAAYIEARALGHDTWGVVDLLNRIASRFLIPRGYEFSSSPRETAGSNVVDLLSLKRREP